MKTVGFPISYKENEKRRAIVPETLSKMRHPEMLFFETGYGEVLGLNDGDYIKAGANVVSRKEVLTKDIICDPKIGDAEYLDRLEGQTVFGWVHAVQNRDITDKLIAGGLTAYAWEDMFEMGRHVFWRNNELAGEAAVMSSFQCFGRMPYETDVAVIGKGNTARGAMRALISLGANVMQYDRHTEALLRKEIGKYDVIINCVLWDVKRKDHIIYRDDLKRMKRGAMIVDVSCDRHGGIETSEPTTIEKPTYVVDGVLHYAVDHTPTIFYKTFSYNNSEVLYPYVDMLICGETDEVLDNALIMRGGQIIDERISAFQGR